MDTANLRLFIDAARLGSFAAVARDRNLDPSSVSRAISAVEAEVGARLFQRTTRRLALTQAGEVYLGKVSSLLDGLEQAQDEIDQAGSDPAGVLRVTTTVSFGQICIVPLLGDFRAAFPRLQLELILSDANLDLVADRIDLALRLAPSYRADVIGVKLFPTRYRVVASPDYLAREGPLASPADLGARDCLLFPLPEFRSRWRFRRGHAIEDVQVHGALVLSTALALRAAAVNGLGPVLLADWHIGDDLRAGRLVDLFPEHDVTATTFDTAAWMLYPSRRYLPAKVRAMITFLREQLPSGR